MEYHYFEDGEDEDIPEEHRRRVFVQVDLRYRLRDALDPFDLSITEFVSLYRIPQHEVYELLDLIRPYMGAPANTLRIPLHLRVLCALGFFAQGSYQRGVGAIGYVCVSQSTMSNVLEEVTQALNHPTILRRLMHFPDRPAEWEHECERSAHLKLPRVLGMIDGTIIKVFAPRKDEHRRAFMTRKGVWGLNVQIVCSSDLYIFDVFARFPGSANDPYIYAASGVRDVMREAFQHSRCYLLGDSIYPLEPWLQTPIPNAEPGTPEFYFTEAHCKDRNAVERCIGVLKGRWRCLTWDRTLHYTPEKAGRLVNACAVVHNFCRLRNAPDPPPYVEPDEEPDNFEIDDPEDIDAQDLRQQALQVRQSLIDHVMEMRGARAQ